MAGVKPGDEPITYTDDAAIVSPLDWNDMVNYYNVKIALLNTELNILKEKITYLESFHPPAP